MDAIPQKNEAEKVQNNNYKFKPYTLLVKKFNPQYYSKKIIKSEISDFFNSPEKFFDVNSPVCINKKINLNKIIPLDILTRKERALKESIKSTKNNSKFSSSLKERQLSHHTGNNKDNQQPIKKTFEVIDNEKLKSIFKSYQNKKNPINEINKSPFKNNIYNNRNNYDTNTIPRQLSLNLSIQNRRLRSKKYLDRQTRNISKYLSRKLHKNESDLLFNGVHLYRYKKEVLNEDEDLDNPKKITEQSCLFKWVSSLRRPKNFYGIRESYVNVSSDTNPLWSIVVERYPITKEMSVKSGYNLNNKDFRDFKRKRNLSSLNSAKLRTVENLDKVNISGKKLFNVEYNREMSNNSSKILHNVFVDNGKVILYKDVNDMFGNETIYKNYNFRNNETSVGSRSLDNMMIRSSSSSNIFK